MTVTTRTLELEEIFAAARAATAWVDRHNGRGEDEITKRLLKIGEEFGEAVAAYLGVTGQNPRKGVTHTTTDVADELADVVLTALVAMTSLGHDPADVLARNARRILARVEA